MNKIRLSAPLTKDVINQINQKAQSEDITIVFDSTRGIRTSDLDLIDNKITISIIGGLNPAKQKFNNEYYQKRTYYSSSELKLIISKFESIERNINPTWNELEKCMYVYKTLCEFSNYDENKYNGRDASRNLLGMITGKSVCSGYAMIFKEAMDRIGIKCYYQNVEGSHSWNAIEIDGVIHSIELTWDTNNKKENKCRFLHFCTKDRKSFYSTYGHDISYESEEKEFDFQKIPVEKLQAAFNKIIERRIIRQNCEPSANVTLYGYEISIVSGVPFLKPMRKNFLNTFYRNDTSSFMLVPTGIKRNGVNEYIYVTYNQNSKEVKSTKIYSEMNLLTTDIDLRIKIKEDLLSQEKINKKVTGFNGYVGYIEKGNSCNLYNARVENSLGIFR